MEKIIWKREYSVGVERLDRQHKKIISVINKLISKPRAFATSGTIAEALSELNIYVSEHFLLEEQLLDENDYPDILDHSVMHTEYGNRIAEFCLKSFKNNKHVREELLSYLSEWWIGHILYEDMKYKRFFEEKGIH